MYRVSTNLTLFYKIFIPTFWIVFFGAFTVAVFFYPAENFGSIPGTPLRIGSFLFFLSGLGLFSFTLLRLKRVEIGEEEIYVTNYFKHAKYPFSNIEKIEDLDAIFLQTATIHLKVPGQFGKKIRFITSRFRYKNFIKQNAHLKAED